LEQKKKLKLKLLKKRTGGIKMKYDKDLYENIELLKEFIATKIITNYEIQINNILNNTIMIKFYIGDDDINYIIFDCYDSIEVRTIYGDNLQTGLWFKPDVGEEIKLTSIDVFKAFEDWKSTKNKIKE